ncbi:hypothetical protein QJS04_geneDACA002973 [Acorus gramineus]|uniref:Uncharacterized protein n=1 Tax=Acorus gramineus TaxID=55184 RepID=A0AAV9BU19_ACOGR|nr:hypothetical protein QJS04_geneDACA002973 [Acorus gramineus]
MQRKTAATTTTEQSQLQKQLTDQSNRTSWEDRSTGEYQRVNSREVVNDNGDYRRYTTVSWGNKSTGYTGKLHAEEKWVEPSPAAQQKYYGSYSKNKYLD